MTALQGDYQEEQLQTKVWLCVRKANAIVVSAPEAPASLPQAVALYSHL